MACTTILVGKKASYDGSTIVARNEDSSNGEFDPKRFVVVKPEDQPKTYVSVLSHCTIELPDNPLQYTAVPNADLSQGQWAEAGINEANVAMSATETITSNERVLGADPLVEYKKAEGTPGEPGYVKERIGGIGEEDFVTIVLPYIRSAREGVERLGKLLAEFGTYEMNGVAFSDVNEIWWMETIGGHHWIAKRVPDDVYVTMPNQFGIDDFDFDDALGDAQQHMCSPGLDEFVRANHLDLRLRSEAPCNPRDMFGSHTDADHVYNTPRAWSIQRFFNPYDEHWDGPKADYTPESDDLPWGRHPERKITIEDVKYALSLHYQGTEYDPYGTRGDEHTRHRYRPIGINRQNHLAVLQIRPYVPEVIRSIQWMAYGSNVFNALVPMYANVNATPSYLENTSTRVTSENFYWANRIIATLADGAFAQTANLIERYQLEIASIGQHVITKTDAMLFKMMPALFECRDCAAAEKTHNSQDQHIHHVHHVFDPTHVHASAILGDEEDIQDQERDVQAIIAAVRNDRVRAVLESSNNRMADALRDRTEQLLSDVLYTASMAMRNGFNRSDH